MSECTGAVLSQTGTDTVKRVIRSRVETLSRETFTPRAKAGSSLVVITTHMHARRVPVIPSANSATSAHRAQHAACRVGGPS